MVSDRKDRCFVVLRKGSNVNVFRGVYDWWKTCESLVICYVMEYNDGTLEPRMKIYPLHEVDNIIEF